MARVLVTGVGGFTGHHLVDRLLQDEHEVHGIEHRSSGSGNGVTLHEADLLDTDRLRAVVGEVRPEMVVHLAAIAFVAHGDVTELYTTNVLGTRNLFQTLVEQPSATSAVLFASSANVYGNQREGQLSESDPVCPANDYGVTKVAGEQLARIYSDRLPMIVVRPFNYTGVGQSTKFLIPKLIDHARRRDLSLRLGNLSIKRDFSDVRSVVDAYARLLNAPKAIGGTFNMCSGEARGLDEILAMVEGAAGLKFDVQVDPSLVRSDEVRSLCGSRERLESVIGPMNTPPLAETIGWMLSA